MERGSPFSSQPWIANCGSPLPVGTGSGLGRGGGETSLLEVGDRYDPDIAVGGQGKQVGIPGGQGARVTCQGYGHDLIVLGVMS